MKYLHLLKNDIEYENYLNSDKYIEPYVVLVEDGEKIYCKQYNTINNYCTFEALEDGLTVKFTNKLEYSINDGEDWIVLNPYTSTKPINAGQRICFRATGLTPTSSAGIGTFTVTKNFALRGNVMSLLFGDESILLHNISEKRVDSSAFLVFINKKVHTFQHGLQLFRLFLV